MIQQSDQANTPNRSQSVADAREQVSPEDIAALVARVAPRPKIPSSTYRIQFGSSFTFRDARDIVPYLHQLGVSDYYASPYLKASPDSTHGYDVADHNALNPAFGSDKDYERFVAALQEHGMGQIMDFVPNHMGISSSANAAWMDVLESGPGSPYAAFFDIEWHPLIVGGELANKVLLPILGDPYGKALENQELRLAYEDGTFYVYYYDTKLPIAPRTQIDLLSFPLDDLIAQLGGDGEFLQEYQSIITALGHLPEGTDTAPEKVAERQREKEVIKRRIANLCQSCRQVREAVDRTVTAYNGVKGEPHSFDRIEALLNHQAYRLAYWRVAAEEINYRRFFDVNDLAAIRMEIPEVFYETHRLVLRQLEEGKVTGLRIDHPDGLWDPAGYFQQLQRRYFVQVARSQLADGREKSDREWQALESRLADWFDKNSARQADKAARAPLYVVAEKILSPGERLPESWPVYGTTGYDFANAVNGIFVARANRKAFDAIYAGFTGMRTNFHNLVNSSKKMIMLISLASEINMLGYQLKRISARNRWYRDFTLNSLTFAIREVIAALPVYRTYVVGSVEGIDRQDRAQVEAAIAEAKKRNPRTAASIFDFVADILLQRYPANIDEEDRRERANFVMKFQQTTGPVMAKGAEDTAFYVYNRLASLNEVGGNPEQFGTTVGMFHRRNAEIQRLWPHSLLATSTHDTKRSEDVRARIDVLSEIPREWKDALAKWSRLNRSKKPFVDGQAAPDPNDEYLLYQTLLGVWPFETMDRAEHEVFVSRIQAYMLKAVKEAKVNTSWINANVPYDEAVQEFVRAVLDDAAPNAFLEDFAVLERKVAHYGAYNSLSQTLLKITSPGVPDIYQGNEIWDFSLVDPDNRRPVDFRKRARMLAALRRQIAEAGDQLVGLAGELLANKEDGRVKLYLTHRSLTYRRDNEALFREGAYVPLHVGGSRREHVCAFARRHQRQVAVVAVPRLLVKLTAGSSLDPLGTEVWADSWLAVPALAAGQRYRNVLTGETVQTVSRDGRTALPLHAVFASFPAALLETIAKDAV